MREARRAVTPAVLPLPRDLTAFALPPAGDPAAWALASSVASEGLWYFDVAADEVRLAPRTLELLGYRSDERPPERTEVGHHVHPRDLVLLQRAIDEVLRGARSRVELDLRLVTIRGELRWAHFRARALRAADGNVRYIAGSIADIDERKRTALQLKEDSRRDALTGLPNRIALDERLVARIAAAASDGRPFGVLYADLDRFKFVNDTLGHSVGDALLLETARRITAVLGPHDMLARIGGDEFVMVLHALRSDSDAVLVADAVQRAMRAPMTLDGEEVHTAISIGVRVTTGRSSKPSDLLRDADIAMYEAKRHGGNRTMMFTDGMYATMVERLKVQTALHRVG
jgi:diguanylate cyclase (GGDEF)-like protein/PAS domain S-box-containing protein